MTEPLQSQALPALLDYIKRSRGFDFTGYKQPSLIRRIQKRMDTVGVNQYIDYIDYLEMHPEEFTLLFNTILINVTGFFRDLQAWEFLREEIVPQLLNARGSSDPIRIWSTGCASGEEAYSIAMLFAEALGREAFRERVKIYATDVDEEALNTARSASYTHKQVEGVPPELLEKYFIRNQAGFIFDSDLRRNLIFGRNDLVQDAPISRVDLLICRNTLMYFTAETQGKIMARFHFALRDSGVLFLGKAEMMLSHSNIFTPLDLKLRIFNKVPRANLRDRLMLMNRPGGEDGAGGLLNLARMRDAAFDSSPVAQVIIDPNHILSLTNESARKLFGINSRDLGRPFQDLDISFRPVELRSSLQRVIVEQHPILIKDVEWPAPNGELRFFDVRILPLYDGVPGSGTGILGISISFVEVSQSKAMQHRLEQANQELETAFEEMQSTNEEMETTNEELQSTIEELETTNEELQSTNEEMETMNEELQSTNEELQTINDELRVRTDELNRINAFVESILTSLHAGVIVMDRDLRVTVWNRKSEDLWGLRPDEVQGQNFLNLDIGLPVDQLKKPIRACLQEKSERQALVVQARNRRGKDICCKVMISPLLDSDREVQGIISLIEEDGTGEAAR